MARPPTIASSWFPRAVPLSVRIISLLGAHIAVLSVRRHLRSMRTRPSDPSAGSRSHPSRFTCPNHPRLSSAYSASCLPTSLLRLHVRALVRLCATDNDRCTNTAALQTDLADRMARRQPSRHRGFIAPSRLRSVSLVSPWALRAHHRQGSWVLVSSDSSPGSEPPIRVYPVRQPPAHGEAVTHRAIVVACLDVVFSPCLRRCLPSWLPVSIVQSHPA